MYTLMEKSSGSRNMREVKKVEPNVKKVAGFCEAVKGYCPFVNDPVKCEKYSTDHCKSGKEKIADAIERLTKELKEVKK